MDCSPPGSSVLGIFQARILEQVAIFSSRGSSWFGDWNHVSCVSCIAGGFLTAEPSGKLPWRQEAQGNRDWWVQRSPVWGALPNLPSPFHPCPSLLTGNAPRKVTFLLGTAHCCGIHTPNTSSSLPFPSLLQQGHTLRIEYSNIYVVGLPYNGLHGSDLPGGCEQKESLKLLNYNSLLPVGMVKAQRQRR